MRTVLLALCAVGLGSTQEDPAALARLIKPQPGESKWAAIPWLTNLKEARERAVREDKPLFLWRAGGGDTLGRA
jgi:hypothetical protein